MVTKACANVAPLLRSLLSPLLPSAYPRLKATASLKITYFGVECKLHEAGDILCDFKGEANCCKLQLP